MSNESSNSTISADYSRDMQHTAKINKIQETYGSDSDYFEETVTGNVSKSAVVGSGCNVKFGKGVLVFDACFESGNLGKVEIISDFEYDLFIRADTCNPKFRVWFNFTVENNRAKQRVIFNVVNFSKTKSLYREGMSPLVRSTTRPFWYRIPHKNVYYYRCPEHRKNYVMSFAFMFDLEDEVYQFCYCYPYTYTRLQTYLDELDKSAYTHYKRELLGLTLQQRRVDLITITHPKNEANTMNKKGKVIFVTSRVHPGETPSSYVCQGFIDFMVSDHPLAQDLRYHLIFKIVPMLNPDGVYLGNYRCSLMGFDLNRQWQDPSQWAHPTIYAAKQLLMKLDQNPNLDVNFFIDIHAHSTLMNGFMYGNVFEDEERAERQAVFPNLLSRFAEDFSLPQTNFNRDALKAGTGRRTLGGILDNRTLCYTLEVSFYSYTNVLTGELVPYTEAKYARLGRNLARTFHEYYSHEGLFLGSVSPVNKYKLSTPNNLKRSTQDDTNSTFIEDICSDLTISQSQATGQCSQGDLISPIVEGSGDKCMLRSLGHLADKAAIARSFSDRLNNVSDQSSDWKESLGGISWRVIRSSSNAPECEQKSEAEY
ncbi:cytosolic carboxypeptidase 6 [Paragonimus heterotremus]|uniref:Cytosolic carboxypeptidase 6 n=1 Tax=Paragonimus heterotremus TaxID=100268 RepID=A0A8J4WUF8_9TREM|nr:cytosolic carboxypeptidase 6 [Paragonimus heterotremus]